MGYSEEKISSWEAFAEWASGHGMQTWVSQYHGANDFSVRAYEIARYDADHCIVLLEDETTLDGVAFALCFYCEREENGLYPICALEEHSAGGGCGVERHFPHVSG